MNDHAQPDYAPATGPEPDPTLARLARSDDPDDLEECIENLHEGFACGGFALWDAILRREQGLELLPASRELLEEAGLLDAPAPSELGGLPRPSEPWWETVRALAPRLLEGPWDLSGARWLPGLHGAASLLRCLDRADRESPLPPEVDDPRRVLEAELLGELALRACLASLDGLLDEVDADASESVLDQEKAGRVVALAVSLVRESEALAILELDLEGLGARIPLDEPHRREVLEALAVEFAAPDRSTPLVEVLAPSAVAASHQGGEEAPALPPVVRVRDLQDELEELRRLTRRTWILRDDEEGLGKAVGEDRLLGFTQDLVRLLGVPSRGGVDLAFEFLSLLHVRSESLLQEGGTLRRPARSLATRALRACLELARPERRVGELRHAFRCLPMPIQDGPSLAEVLGCRGAPTEGFDAFLQEWVQALEQEVADEQGSSGDRYEDEFFDEAECWDAGFRLREALGLVGGAAALVERARQSGSTNPALYHHAVSMLELQDGSPGGSGTASEGREAFELAREAYRELPDGYDRWRMGERLLELAPDPEARRLALRELLRAGHHVFALPLLVATAGEDPVEQERLLREVLRELGEAAPLLGLVAELGLGELDAARTRLLQEPASGGEAPDGSLGSARQGLGAIAALLVAGGPQDELPEDSALRALADEPLEELVKDRLPPLANPWSGSDRVECLAPGAASPLLEEPYLYQEVLAECRRSLLAFLLRSSPDATARGRLAEAVATLVEAGRGPVEWEASEATFRFQALLVVGVGETLARLGDPKGGRALIERIQKRTRKPYGLKKALKQAVQRHRKALVRVAGA